MIVRFAALLVVWLGALAFPAVALAHDQPETKQSRWVMADWMMDTFFIFSGLAVVAFLAAWKAGHFQELDRMGGIPLLVGKVMEQCVRRDRSIEKCS